MDPLFVIEDELHGELVGRFPLRQSAIAELRRLAALPWDTLEVRAPCTAWRTCGRNYELVTYDAADHPWKEIQREQIVEIRAEGVTWKVGDPAHLE